MPNTIKKGESLFIPFKNGETIRDSQNMPRMYKTKAQYDRYSYCFGDAEMVEYAEVVRCRNCRFAKKVENFCLCTFWGIDPDLDHFCSEGKLKDNDT